MDDLPEINGKPFDEVLYDRGREHESIMRQRAIKMRAARKENFEIHKTGLSGKQVRLCHLVALGTPYADAYRQAGYGDASTPKVTATNNAYGILKNPRVAKYFSELQESAYLANVLSLAEKRSFLADVVRTSVGELTLQNKLAQRVRYHKGEMVELSMPDKIKAVELDAKLAGELKENSMHVNVGLALVNERLANINLPKDAL
jgi:hypothetical protein